MNQQIQYSNEELSKINNQLLERIWDILNYFDIKLNEYGTYLVGSCPVHQGDNQSACNVHINGNRIGQWVCWTHHCEKKFQKTIIGFVRGLLSRHYNTNVYSWYKTLEWIEDFLKTPFSRKIIVENNQPTIKKDLCLDINTLKQRLKIPSYYFLNKGYSEQILRKYYVGVCENYGAKQYKRSVVPILDNTGKRILACAGRSVFDKCSKCGLYHGFDCPTQEFAPMIYTKWKNSGNVAHYLYNFWNAKKYIKNTYAILVEGASDVWRLEEFNIKNSLGLMTNKITDAQSILLELLNIKKLLIMMDNDEGGEIGYSQICNKLGSQYDCVKIPYSTEDPGKLSKEKIGEVVEFLKQFEV